MNIKTVAQLPSTPLRIVENTVHLIETNSKRGEHTVTKKQLELIYKDGTREVLTTEKFEELIRPIPQAHGAWKKYKANNAAKVSSLPFLAVGFIGGINILSNNEHKSRNALIGVAGLAGAVTLFNYFDHKALRYKNKTLLLYNQNWSIEKSEPDLKDIISPDIIRLGGLNNSFGLGFTWVLGK